MKRTLISAIALVIAISTIVTAFIFAAPVAYASEAETIAPPTEENATQPEISDSTEDVTEKTDTNIENITTSEEKTSEANPQVETDNRISYALDAITNSSLWVSIGAFVLSAIGIIAFVGKKTSAIFELIKGKADKTVITSEFKSGVKEIKEAFDEEYRKINAELEAHDEKEKQMWAMLTIFMTHAKIPTAAKAEIINCITGIKDMTGDIKEIVESAEKAICEAEKEAEKNALPTPALDKIINENSEYNIIELG